MLIISSNQFKAISYWDRKQCQLSFIIFLSLVMKSITLCVVFEDLAFKLVFVASYDICCHQFKKSM